MRGSLATELCDDKNFASSSQAVKVIGGTEARYDIDNTIDFADNYYEYE
jgi:hypothetical protein